MKIFQKIGGGDFYISPEIEVTEIACDRGFGDSMQNESFSDGGSLSWDDEE